MASFKIEGGHKLNGTITPQGAKNEVLQILCAVLLTPEQVIVKNIPDIIDVNKLIFILGEASFTGSAGTNYYVELEGEKTAMTGRFYFVWFVCVAAIQVFFCN